MKITVNIEKFLSVNIIGAEVTVNHWMGGIGTIKGGPTVLSCVKDWDALTKFLEAEAEKDWLTSDEYKSLRDYESDYKQNNENETEKGPCPDEWYDNKRMGELQDPSDDNE